MRVGVLAVQGAFIEHEKKLEELGVESFEIRQQKDLEQDFQGLILPGGESTVQGQLMKRLGLFNPIKTRIQEGLPVLATCAGLILLAQEIADDTTVHLGTLPVRVKRNAYGRQLGSFYVEERFGSWDKIPMTFIRAPYVEAVNLEIDSLTNKNSDKVEILATVEEKIVAVRYKKQIALAFHPELNEDNRIHQLFLESL